MKKPRIPIPSALHPAVDDDTLRCLGLVFVRFSELEFRISLFLMELLATDYQRGRAITFRMSFSEQIESLKRLLLLEPMPSRLKEETLKVIVRCTAEESRRNQLAHSVWGFGPDGSTSRMKTTKDKQVGLKWKTEDIDASVLHDDAKRIMHLLDDLNLATQSFFCHKHPKASREVLRILDEQSKWMKLLDA